jgi:thiosulfate/3-mercaptopyruvate sulfurtransferase
MFHLLCAVVWVGAAEAEQPDRYAKPQLLIEAAELAGRLGEKNLAILDCRSRAKYDAGHVPGALWIDVAEWAKEFSNGDHVAAWEQRLGRLGLATDLEIVVYDDLVRDAARVWWLLRYWGYDKVRLLNGGWTGWQAAGLPTQTEAPPPRTAVALRLRPNEDVIIRKQQVLLALEKKDLQIVDARSEDEYCGRMKLAKRGGAIPGARLLDWTELLDGQTKRFKKPEELRRLFAKAGVDCQAATMTYCQSGGRASVMAFALELMGCPQVRNYYASWAEWGNAEDTPVVEPNKPKP